MFAKGAIAGFLIAVLLAMSSWSSACDLSCALKSRHVGCAAEQTSSAKNAAPTGATAEMDMSHCIHAARSDEELPADQSLSVNPCAHDACRLIAVSTPAKNSAARLQQRSTASMFAVSVQPLVSHPNTQFTEREYPPPKTSSFDRLSITLRI